MVHVPICRQWKRGKMKREYTALPAWDEWLNTWQERGMETTAQEFAKTNIKNFYYFGDFFCKFRFARGKRLGMMPVAGMESVENKHCRLATTRQDIAYEQINYSDFHHIAVGRWSYGLGNYKIYPKFALSEIDNYLYAAVSHHREKSVDEFYGVNETHQGARPYILGSNSTATYINSFCVTRWQPKSTSSYLTHGWSASVRSSPNFVKRTNYANQKIRIW